MTTFKTTMTWHSKDILPTQSGYYIVACKSVHSDTYIFAHLHYSAASKRWNCFDTTDTTYAMDIDFWAKCPDIGYICK